MSAEDAASIAVCPDCGFENPPGTRFCGNCGVRREGEAVASRADASPTQSVMPKPAPPATDLPATSLPDRYVALSPAQREAELQRLLTRANVERMRAMIVPARKTLDEAEPLARALGEKAVAQVLEQRGDMLAMEERWEAARQAYADAHAADPSRALAEKKYAEMTVRLADEEALKRLGGAMLRGDSIGEILSDPRAGKRNAGVAMLASAMVPGLGQILAGQFVKGAICMGVWIVCLGWIGLSPDRQAFVATVTGLFNPQAVAKIPKDISVGTWMAMVGVMVAWFYSVFEAPVSASKTTALAGSANLGDKSGWEP